MFVRDSLSEAADKPEEQSSRVCEQDVLLISTLFKYSTADDVLDSCRQPDAYVARSVVQSYSP
jgi:hypothetical protein